MGLSIGTPETINFPFGTNGKLMVLGIPIFKHIRVIQSRIAIFTFLRSHSHNDVLHGGKEEQIHNKHLLAQIPFISGLRCEGTPPFFRHVFKGRQFSLLPVYLPGR